MRKLSFFDKLISEVDQALRTVHTLAPTTERPYPAEGVDKSVELSEDEKKLSVTLMRVNHAGEVSAQGLYRGQALTAKREDIREQMERSAMEENDHLNWCERRLTELGDHKSYLGPVWYMGSFGLGAVAGLVGDKWSLGFLEETEHQVTAHLEEHLQGLPAEDTKSRAIVAQMRLDEMQHAEMAHDFGAAPLPLPVKEMMKLSSKIMTTISYRF